MYCDVRLAGVPQWSSHEPANAKMRIPDDIKKCVCFLSVKDNGKYRYGGTAMILTLKEGRNDDLFWTYLVTARHCVEAAKNTHGDLYARFNMRDGPAQLVKLEDKWIYPADESVDVAVLPVLLGPEVEYGTVSNLMIASDYELAALNIGIGDDLVIIGLFTQRYGTQRNIPILRSGIIASMPDEPLEDQNTGKPYNAYLIEVRSIGGLSGSPVFVALDTADSFHQSRRTPNEARLFLLLGIVRGHWDLKTSAMDFLEKEDSKLNMGIAIVTPIHEVMEVVAKDENLVRQRKNIREEYRKRTAPTEDSAFSDSTPETEFTRADFEATLRKVSRKMAPEK